jgi:hypothetical protein
MSWVKQDNRIPTLEAPPLDKWISTGNTDISIW